MKPFEIIPYGRDLKAKKLYKFMSWFIRDFWRENKKEIKKQWKKAILEKTLYGNKKEE